MTVASALELVLAVVVLGVAVWTVAARETFAAVAGFIVDGLLIALVWVRVNAVDVALTEAAISGGLGGVLMLGAAARLRMTEASAERERPSALVRIVAAVLSATLAAALAVAVLSLPDPAPTLAPAAAANAAATSLGNPVTNVLMAFRAMDTMLEKVVLLLALVGVWSLAPDHLWGGRPGLRHQADPNGVLAFLARLLPPIGIVVGIYLLWVSADHPGGAFQGGTILAAMWLLVMMAGLSDAPPIGLRRLRLTLVAGPAVFFTVGLGGLWLGAAFLAYPVAYAKPLILAIEVAMTLTIAVTLGLWMAGAPVRRAERRRRRPYSGCAPRSQSGSGSTGWSRIRGRCAKSLLSICSAAACSCCSAWSRGGARRRGSAAIQFRRRWSLPESSSPSLRRRSPSRCCCDSSRRPIPRPFTTHLQNHDARSGLAAGPVDRRPAHGRAARLCRRWPSRRADRAGDDAARSGDCARDPRRSAAARSSARLSARWLGATARRGAARRWIIGGHDGGHRGRRLRHRCLCTRGLPHAGLKRDACAICLLDPAAGGLGCAEHGLSGRRPLYSLCGARAADLRGRTAGVPRRPRGNGASCAALSAVCAARFGPLSRRHGAALRHLRHARHCPALGAYRPDVRDARRRRADDGGAARQDRTRPVVSVAAASACWSAARRQRDALGAGGEGLVLHRRPAVVRRDAGPAELHRRAAPHRARRGGDRARQHRGAATGAAEALDRLFDLGADRLPVPDVRACIRPRIGAAGERRRVGRRHAAGNVTCHREGRHVHGRRIDLRSVRP